MRLSTLILDKFEDDLKWLDGCFYDVSAEVTQGLMKRVSLALAAVSKAGDAVRRLNQFERYAVKQLIHYH